METVDADEVVGALDRDRLCHRCDPERFDFETTRDLEALDEVLGQPRASAALEFGVRIEGQGYNVFALGPEDLDKRRVARHFVERQAGQEETPRDLCYVHNFQASHQPRSLRLPPGVGRELAEDVDAFLRDLRPALRGAFESEDYQTRRQAIQQEVSEEQGEAFERLREKAREQGLALIRTPAGFAFSPIKDGEVLSPEEWDELSEEEREAMDEKTEELEEELQGIMRQVPQHRREVRERLRDLNREVARWAVQDLIQGLRTSYDDYPAVQDHLDAIEEDVVDNVEELMEQDGNRGQGAGGGGAGGPATSGGDGGPLEGPQLRRYRVNVVVDHGDSETAPVIYEDHPTYQNLVGRVEYQALMGALITDFNLIKGGALHRANGGYLILDARQLLLQPLAYEELKRVLESGELRIESPRQALGLVRTVSLEPEPVELDVKVILLGDRMLYYLLSELDPDFPRLFKVAADFADEMDRDEETERRYARMVAELVRREDLLPFHRDAVARVVERSARHTGDAAKLTVRTEKVQNLLREADHWAREEGAEVVRDGHVRTAIDQWTFRSDRLRERTQEQILRDTVYIDTEGRQLGQVNGLSVLEVGGFRFGRPNRITARVRLGEGEVVDIEREVELGGPIHSKGVMILSGFLGARYASDLPLSLSATLVFEQSYGGIEGDSASSAELYALLSAIADLPLKQSVAVTGSVNQHGEIQPIGGVNPKIEGFFDICRQRGLTGDQGVLVPAANVKHLMLRDEVVDAAAAGDFHIWPVETVDQGMAILSGIEMGEPDEEGRYPRGTVNAMVREALAEMAEQRRAFASGGHGTAGEA